MSSYRKNSTIVLNKMNYYQKNKEKILLQSKERYQLKRKDEKKPLTKTIKIKVDDPLISNDIIIQDRKQLLDFVKKIKENENCIFITKALNKLRKNAEYDISNFYTKKAKQ